MQKTIDARGLMCPQPVIMAKRELSSMETGAITVLVDNATASRNLQDLAATQGLDAQTEQQGDDFAVTISKAAAAEAAALANSGAIVLISSDKFGDGDEQFSQTLLRNFIFALTEVEAKPATMLFVNKGAFFTCENSPVLESLHALEEGGVEILTCGACLDFYGLKESLQAGKVTNMYVIAEKLLSATNVVKP